MKHSDFSSRQVSTRARRGRPSSGTPTCASRTPVRKCLMPGTAFNPVRAIRLDVSAMIEYSSGATVAPVGRTGAEKWMSASGTRRPVTFPARRFSGRSGEETACQIDRDAQGRARTACRHQTGTGARFIFIAVFTAGHE